MPPRSRWLFATLLAGLAAGCATEDTSTTIWSSSEEARDRDKNDRTDDGHFTADDVLSDEDQLGLMVLGGALAAVAAVKLIGATVEDRGARYLPRPYFHKDQPYVHQGTPGAEPTDDRDSTAMTLVHDWIRDDHDRIGWSIGATARTPGSFSYQGFYLQDIDGFGDDAPDRRRFQRYTGRISPFRDRPLMLDVGLGVCVVDSGRHTFGGGCAQAELVWLPRRPWIIRAGGSAGAAAGPQMVGDAEVSFGAIRGHVASRFGWRALFNSDEHDLGGPMMGVEFWF